MVNRKSNKKQVFLVLFLFFLVLVVYVIKPYIIPLVSAAVIAYIFYPIYSIINKKLKSPNITALIMSILIIVLISIPFVIMINTVYKESFALFLLTKQKVQSGELVSSCEPDSEGWFCHSLAYAKQLSNTPEFNAYFIDSVQKFSTYLIKSSSDFIFSIPSKLINIFVLLFSLFFFLRDGEKLSVVVYNILPLKSQKKKEVFNRTQKVTKGVIYGSLLTSLLQGFIAGIFYFLFGVSSPITFSLLTAVAALIPFFGTFIIWFPLAMSKLVNGALASDNTLIWQGVGLLVFCGAIVSTSDNILRPKLVGEGAQVHPLIVLIGVLGGLQVFGFMGFILGPVVLAVFLSILKIYEEGSAL